MPRTTLARRDNSVFDKATELRNYSAAAVTGDTNGTGIEYYSLLEISFRVIVKWAAIGGTVDGSNFWTINVQVSDTLGGTYVTIGSHVLPAAAGEVPLSFTGKYVESKLSNAKFIRVQADETGTTAGDLTYGAFIAPSNC